MHYPASAAGYPSEPIYPKGAETTVYMCGTLHMTHTNIFYPPDLRLCIHAYTSYMTPNVHLSGLRLDIPLNCIFPIGCQGWVCGTSHSAYLYQYRQIIIHCGQLKQDKLCHTHIDTYLIFTYVHVPIVRAYLDHGIYTGCIVTHKCAEQILIYMAIHRISKSLSSHKTRFTLYSNAHAYGYRCACVPSLYMLGGYVFRQIVPVCHRCSHSHRCVHNLICVAYIHTHSSVYRSIRRSAVSAYGVSRRVQRIWCVHIFSHIHVLLPFGGFHIADT